MSQENGTRCHWSGNSCYDVWLPSPHEGAQLLITLPEKREESGSCLISIVGMLFPPEGSSDADP